MMEPFWITFAAIYSALFTLQICLFFRHRAQARLRAEHAQERDAERKMRDAERPREPWFTSSPSFAFDISPRYRSAFEQGRLEGQVRSLSSEVARLTRRVASLEAERPEDQSGAA
jgi:hypothetical protein